MPENRDPFLPQLLILHVEDEEAREPERHQDPPPSPRQRLPLLREAS